MTENYPKPPSHLAPATKAWWRNVVKDYLLEPHHLKLLQSAAEAWDRMQDARSALDQHGTIYTDRFGAPKARPEVVIERDSRIAFARLIRELDLDVEPPRSERFGPPSLKSNRRVS